MKKSVFGRIMVAYQSLVVRNKFIFIKVVKMGLNPVLTGQISTFKGL